MNVMKNRDNKRDWNKWKDSDREDAILKEIDKVAPPWVETDPNGKMTKMRRNHLKIIYLFHLLWRN